MSTIEHKEPAPAPMPTNFEVRGLPFEELLLYYENVF